MLTRALPQVYTRVPTKVGLLCYNPIQRLPLECSRECSRGCPRKCTRSGLVVCHLVKKAAERKFPEFFKFSSRILPRILLRIFPEFVEDFSCFVSWETETRKNSPKIPAIFQCKIPRQTRKKNIHKILLESRQSKYVTWSVFTCSFPYPILPGFDPCKGQMDF